MPSSFNSLKSYLSMAVILGNFLFSLSTTAIPSYPHTTTHSKVPDFKSSTLPMRDRQIVIAAVRFATQISDALRLNMYDYKIMRVSTGTTILFRIPISLNIASRNIMHDPTDNLILNLNALAPEAGKFVKDFFRKHNLIVSESSTGLLKIKQLTPEIYTLLHKKMRHLGITSRRIIIGIERGISLSDNREEPFFNFDRTVKAFLPKTIYADREIDRPWLDKSYRNPFLQPVPANPSSDVFSVKESNQILENTK